MAQFVSKKFDKSSIKQGEKYNKFDIPTAAQFNAIVEGVMYATEKAEEGGSSGGEGGGTTEIRKELDIGQITTKQTIINGVVTSLDVGGGATEIKLTDDDFTPGQYLNEYGILRNTDDVSIATTARIAVTKGQTVELNGIYLKNGMSVAGFEGELGFAEEVYKVGDSDENPITQFTIDTIEDGVNYIQCTVRMGTPLIVKKYTAGSGEEEEVETPNVSLTDYIEVAEGSKIEITNAYLLNGYNVGGFDEKETNTTINYATGTSDAEPITSVIISSIGQGIKYIRIPFLASIPPTVFQYTTVTTGGGTGENGATFYPSVSESGIISWTNDKGLTNPKPVDIAKNVKDVCVAKNQGVANVGKILVVGTDGNFTLADMPEGGASGDIIGTLDESNNILLSGNLADGKYTLKYENKDGTYTEIGTLEVGEIIAEPTNLFVIGGEGYIRNGRCSSAGADRSDTDGNVVSNYIKVSKGDTVYLNKPIATSTGEYSGMKLTDGTVKGFAPSDTAYISNLSTANGITQFMVSNANADYIRLTMNVNYGTAITEEDVVNAGIIITVNEPLS